MSLTGQDGVPVTVFSGALGAGKTTTLNHLLSNAGGRRLAVLVNDMGAVNVDAELIEARGDGITELSNGCICCDLRDDLEVAVSRLARRRDFDHLVVESSGISEPAPVARLFTTGPASAPYRLDTLATVVDAANFRSTLADDEVVTTEDLRRKRPGQAEREGEVRPLSDLLIAQVECADVLLVNKCDLVDESAVEETESLLEALNPDARRYRTTRGRVDPDAVLDTGLFDHDTVSETASWKRALEHAAAHDRDDERERGVGGDHAGADHDHVHDPQSTYGVTSFPFRSERPLHPGRFASFLSDLPESVVRSKGIVWVAGREDVALRYSGVGPTRRVEVRGNWVAALPPERQETQRRMRPDLPWDEEWGDRRTELVFIGRRMDETALRERLADCPLTDAEMDTDWSTFENPFPEAEGEELAFG